MASRIKTSLRIMRKNSVYYILFLPVVVFFIVFNYVPMYGVIIAFKNFRISDGILGSAWNGLYQFRRVFVSDMFWTAFFNTLKISGLKILFGFPAPIIFALLISELRFKAFKRTIQTISYLPHFMSWVVLSGILVELLSPTRGVVNEILRMLGREPIYFLASQAHFVPVLVISSVWQGVGWGSIVYLAAITSVDQEQYESAYIDGANRWHCAVRITLPSILPVISIMFILNLGGLLNAGFDQVFNLYNTAVYKVADIIDTYVYRVGFTSFVGKMDYSYATAIGLFKNVIGFALVIGANMVVRRFQEGENAIW